MTIFVVEIPEKVPTRSKMNGKRINPMDSFIGILVQTTFRHLLDMAVLLNTGRPSPSRTSITHTLWARQ